MFPVFFLCVFVQDAFSELNLQIAEGEELLQFDTALLEKYQSRGLKQAATTEPSNDKAAEAGEEEGVEWEDCDEDNGALEGVCEEDT